MTAREIFATAAPDGGDGFAYYTAELQVTDRIIGGIPKDPDTIRKWLESRVAGGADLSLQAVIDETTAAMRERGDNVSWDAILDETTRALEGGNGFKSVPELGLVYEGRCLKAALKEAANVAYPGTNFPGKPQGIRKGLMRYLAERVFVEQNYLPLGVEVPDGTEQRIKHVLTPQGPRSAINVVDYVTRPTITATIAVLDDFLPAEAWGRIWRCAEEIGIGADRARSDGRFELTRWDRH